MRPGEQLFESFSGKVEAVTPALFAYEETRKLTNKTIAYAREHCSSLVVPRLGHHKTALQRAINPEGLVIPSGKVYATGSYEDFSFEGSAAEEFSIEEPAIEYESRLLVLTNDKEEDQSRIGSALNRIFDERPQHKGVFVVFGLVSPKVTSKVMSVDAIMFAVVQSSSGEAYGFTFKENGNKGKIRATEALSDSYGELRDSYGPIDTCSVEATSMTPHDLALIRAELQKANEVFHNQVKDEKNKPGMEVRAQSIGKSVLERAKVLRSRISTSAR